jgi:hypothetical protein
MNKANRCLLHLACIARKLPRGTPIRWHVDHLMREFGMGIYCKKPINHRDTGNRGY